MHSTDTIPPMPDLRCPSWCEGDHEADWQRHVAVGLDTRRIPDGHGGYMSEDNRCPIEQWATLDYFEPLHLRTLTDVALTEHKERARIDLQRGSEGETCLYVDAAGPISAAQARKLAADLLNAADELDAVTD
jgi:hypothetical protein